MEGNQSAARNARRYLSDRVRNDWNWPDYPRLQDASEEELKGVLEFRERFHGTPSESEPEAESKLPGDAYKFDSPDSVGLVVTAKKEEKMLARRKALEEEMTWNEGLSTFEQRRDLWTGAAAARKHRKKPRKQKTSPQPTESVPEDQSYEPVENEESEDVGKSPQDSANGITHYFADTHISPPSSEPSTPQTLVPVAPTLLPENAIRHSITPQIYPDIYNKVVLSARTPSVPINLKDMTRALVQGWKDHGEWPPKPGQPDPLPGTRRKSLSAVLKDLKDRDEPLFKHHPSVRRGVDTVKKVFRISGSQGSGSSQNSPAPK